MISDLLNNVVTRYKADASDHIAEIKKLKGEQRELAQAELEASEARKAQAETWMKSLGEITIAMGALKLAFDGYKLGLHESRLETQAAAINVDELSDAFGGLHSRMEVLEFAAKSQSGALKLNQADLEAVANAVHALEAKGFDGAEAMKAFETAIISGKDRGLQQFGIIVDKTGLQTDEFGVKIDTLGQKHEMLRRIVDAARDSTQGFDAAQASASEGVERSTVSLTDAFDQLKIAMGDLVAGMAPAITDLKNLIDLTKDLVHLAKIVRDAVPGGGGDSSTISGWDFADPRNWLDPTKIPRQLYANYKNPAVAWDGTPGQIVPPNIDQLAAEVGMDPATLAEEVKGYLKGIATSEGKAIEDYSNDLGLAFGLMADSIEANQKDMARQAAEAWKQQHEKILALVTKQVKDDTDAVIAALEQEQEKGITAPLGSGDYLGPQARKAALAQGLPYGPDDVDTSAPRHVDLAGEREAGTTTDPFSYGGAALETRLQGILQQIDKADALMDRARGNDALTKIFGPIEEFRVYEQAFKGLEKASTAAFNAWIEGSESAGDAFKKAIGKSIEALADQMLVRSISEAAWAIGDLAIGNFAGAELHGIAAAEFAAGALAAGTLAHEMGASWGIGNAPTGGGGSAPQAPSTHNPSSGSGSPTQQVIIVYGDAFASDSPYQRQRDAKKIVDAALGGQGGSGR